MARFILLKRWDLSYEVSSFFQLINIVLNLDIAQICFIRKYIEMLGSGTLRMIRDCKNNKFRQPVWNDQDNILRLTFPGVSHARKNEGVNEGVNLRIEGVNDQVQQELNKVLQFLRSNSLSKAPEVAAHLNKGVSL